jgi:predicted O-linked N-acetylglucosamine transferase (SPINDLY family)
MDTILQNINTGKYTDALRMLNSLLSSHQDKGLIFRLLGITYHRMKQFDKSLKMFKCSYNNNIDNKETLDAMYKAYMDYITPLPLLEQKKVLKEMLQFYTFDHLVHFYLGMIYKAQNKKEKAVMHLQLSIRYQSSMEANFELGLLYREMGKYDEMLKFANTALSIKSHPKLYNLLACYYHEKSNHDEAVKYFNLGLKEQGLTEEDKKILLTNMSSTYALMNNYNDAMSCIETASAISLQDKDLDSKLKESMNMNLGLLYLGKHLHEKAEMAYLEALKTNKKPRELLTIHDNLASIYSAYGEARLAISHYDEIIKMDKLNEKDKVIEVLQNKIYATNFINMAPEERLKEHLVINEYFKDIVPFKPLKYNHKKLRVGYISADFNDHPVMTFMKKLLTKCGFDTYCYSNTKKLSNTTEQLKTQVNWRDIVKIDDKTAAEMIMKDEIDVLIDLAGHTAGNRLTIFAYKPCSCQVTFIGYPNTTGMKTMNYRITDEYTDPPSTQKYFTEKLVYLNPCFVCHDTTKLYPIDKQRHDGIVFGIFNKFNKISQSCFNLWKQILDEVPNSKLLFKFRFRMVEKICKKIKDKLGVTDDRLIFIDCATNHDDHMTYYNMVDICLDTFPYSGTTTTCESLLMGCPVVTYYKNGIHSHNVSSSILHNIGHDELIAHSDNEYVKLAVEVAKDKVGLKHYLENLRQQFIDNNDENKYITNFEKLIKSLV